MPRPQFTEAEESYIDHIRNHEASPRQVWGFYLPCIAVATAFFVAGLLLPYVFFQILGYALVVFFLVRFVIYQCKPGWRPKPILDKYEQSFSGQ